MRKEPLGAQPLLCVHWWRCEGRRGKGIIPDKCFLPFRDHGLARVQPQTQCTMTAAAREEKLRGKGKRKEKKKHLEFRTQTVVSIKVTGTRENSLKRQYWHSAWPGTLLPLLRKTAMVQWSAFQSGLHRRCRPFWRHNPFLQWHWSQQCLPVWGWCLLGPQLCQLWVTGVSPLCSLRTTVLSQFWCAQKPQTPSSHIYHLYILSFKYWSQIFHVHVSDAKRLGHFKKGYVLHSLSP